MKIVAHLDNSLDAHRVTVETEGTAKELSIPEKEGDRGSAVNGGELLCLALATCYCNDIYREAAKRGIEVRRVEVQVEAEFGVEGEPARRITYSAKLESDAGEDEIRDLIRFTDTVAEIQNTLRRAVNVSLQN